MPGREFAASALPLLVYLTITGVGFFARQLGISIIVVLDIKLVILFAPAFIVSIAGGFGVMTLPSFNPEKTPVLSAEIVNCCVTRSANRDSSRCNQSICIVEKSLRKLTIRSDLPEN